MTRLVPFWRTLSVVAASLGLFVTGAAADQTGTGAWNDGANRVATGSALVTSSLAFIKSTAAQIKDAQVRQATEDAVFNVDTCVRSRAGLTTQRKQQIVEQLASEGLIDREEAGRIPGGLVAGVFPGVRDEGTDCPKLPLPYAAAPAGWNSRS